MTKSKFPCKNHPKILSVRKCYECQEYICSECQIHRFHHLFCSYWCIFKHFLNDYLPRQRLLKDYGILIAIMIFLQIVFYVLIVKNKEFTESQSIEENPRIEEIVYSDKSKFLIDTVYSHISQALKIIGRGENNRLLGLWHNGHFSGSAVTNKEVYEFSPQILFLGNNSFTVRSLTENGISTLVDSFSLVYSSPRIRSLAVPLSKLKTEQKIIALTFDAGSSANGADSILHILNTLDIRSTFFLTGAFIKRFPEIVQTIINNNHELANHTYSHPHLTTFAIDGKANNRDHVNRYLVYEQLNKTDSLFNASFGQHLKPFWRAPFGEYNQQILNWAAELGYRHIGWSPGCDTRDWVSDQESPLYLTAAEIYDHLMALEINGDLHGAIILMHLHSDRTNDMPYKILKKLINQLISRNYKIVTISKLLLSVFPT